VAAAACAICLEDFEAGDGLAVMPCDHRFHERCLTEWLALSRLCPCCRHALPSADEDKGEAPHADAGQGFPGRVRQAATRRSRRARQANVRLFGPEWAATPVTMGWAYSNNLLQATCMFDQLHGNPGQMICHLFGFMSHLMAFV
jgi:hypothetical protein